MKYLKIIYKKIFVFSSLLMILTTLSCNDDFLEEVPRSFLSPENAFTDKQGFDAGLTAIYSQLHDLYSAGGGNFNHRDDYMSFFYGTDIGGYWNKVSFFGDYNIINSNTAFPRKLWTLLYEIIKDSNTILTRSESELAVWESDADKSEILAQARFYRAFAYRYLVYFFGGVPIVGDEISGVKLDFVRDSKTAVLEFMKTDLEYASQNLPVNNPKDGRLAKAAADHLLAETYISLGEYDKAIQAATAVIGDGQYDLMRNRFGAFTDKPGDVFWDLFRLGSQNDASNTEVIWTMQVEFNVPGGKTNKHERCWGPFLERIKSPDNKQAILKDDFLGRPVGFIKPMEYMETTIWLSDWDNDIRNSPYNMQREFLINNPASANFGDVIIPTTGELARNHYVWVKKASHPYGHPQGYDTGGNLYSDMYVFRLAETYLLRAEAYVMKGDNTNAAVDINEVRNRANATPVASGDVDIHYILDERARELLTEEPRQLILRRMGLLEERVKMYNPVSATTITTRDELLPIPQAEIDANLEADLTQNPGYDGQ
jgi:hypothetical protein